MERIHGGNIYALANELHMDPMDVLDYSANINPLGYSVKAYQQMTAALSRIIHYPEPHNTDLLNAISEAYQMPVESIVAGNGAAEILYAIGRLPNFTGAFVPAPGFSEYEHSAIAGYLPIMPIYYQQKLLDAHEYQFTVPYLGLQSFAAKLKGQDGRIICFLGNPNNPCGTLLEEAPIRQLASMLRNAHSLLVIDESFIDFLGTDGVPYNPHSLRHLALEYDNVVIVHSLTKFYGVPGLRLGVAFCGESLANQLREQIPTWSVNALAQVYGTEAVQDKDYITKTQTLLDIEKAYMVEHIRHIPVLQYVMPSVNYMLLHKAGPVAPLQNYMNEHGIMIRDCEMYAGLGEGWFRIAIKEHTKNEKFITRLQQYFTEKGT